MITPYYGEFLLTPMPLELSTNWCTHACAYCFANLNKPDRKAAPQSIVNLLAEMHHRDTLVARLLRDGYPVLMSNKVDPFAASNWKLTLQILELFAALGIKVAFQTKGGKGLREAMDLIGPSCFYFSITANDDETCKRIEPGAPTITERFEQMAMLREAGHHVWAGVNPMVRQWIPDLPEFAERLKGEGVTNVWTEIMHLSRDQIEGMTPKEVHELSAGGVLEEAKLKKIPVAAYNHQIEFIAQCQEREIDVCCKHFPGHSTALNAYHKSYTKIFPTMTDFTNHAWETMAPGETIDYNAFKSFMMPKLPAYPHRDFTHYIASCSRVLAKEHPLGKSATIEEVLRVVWDKYAHRMNPRRSLAFKKVYTNPKKTGPDDDYLMDSDGLPVITFTGRILERR